METFGNWKKLMEPTDGFEPTLHPYQRCVLDQLYDADLAISGGVEPTCSNYSFNSLGN